MNWGRRDAIRADGLGFFLALSPAGTDFRTSKKGEPDGKISKKQSKNKGEACRSQNPGKAQGKARQGACEEARPQGRGKSPCEAGGQGPRQGDCQDNKVLDGVINHKMLWVFWRLAADGLEKRQVCGAYNGNVMGPVP